MSTDHPALAGLDCVAWPDLDHAYGPAADTPEWLRQLADGTDEQAEEAVQELWSSICHQGSVYSASAAAAPFLARLAASGVRAADLLGLLGVFAESADERGQGEKGAARRAVAAQYDLLALLAEGSPDDHIRSAALFTLANIGPDDRVMSLLEQSWRVETDPEMRCGVLGSAMVQNPLRARLLAESVLDDTQPPPLRLAAALACVRGGRVWDDDLAAAGSACVRAGLEQPVWGWEQEPYGELVAAVAENAGASAAAEFVTRALAQDAGPITASMRYAALSAADDLVSRYRSAASILAEPVAALVRDRRIGSKALHLLRSLGTPPDPEHVETVAEIAADANAEIPIDPAGNSAGSSEVDPARSHDPDPDPDLALACLIEWADPRAAPLLAANLTTRPRALQAAADLPDRCPGTALAFDAGLLEAIRTRLRDTDGPETPHQQMSPGDMVNRQNQPIHLARVLRSWGPAAAPALPELIALLDSQPLAAAPALAAIGQAPKRCREALRAAAYAKRVECRLAAGTALHDLTGESQPLLDAVVFGLEASRRDLSATAQAAAKLVEHRDALVPLLIEALESRPAPSQTFADLDARVGLSTVLWQFTGAGTQAVAAVQEALSWGHKDFGHWTAAAGADAAATSAADAHALIPALESLLDNRIACPAAVHALLRIDRDRFTAAEPRALLAEKLIGALVDGPVFRAQRRAVEVLGELAAVGLPTTVVNRLRGLADQDRRLIHRGLGGDFVHDDEVLRTEILALLRAVAPQA